jgi:ADP-ribosyl-[dinitrogen reductase] hydrolase
MTEITLLERYKGAMVGVLVGDSVGAPYETWGAQKIAEDIEARGGLTFFDYENPWKHELGPKILPAGRPTDDSDQTADLAWSLIECKGLDVAHLREALRDSVVRHKSRLWDGTALGAGGTTKKALSDDPSKVTEAMNNNIGTNGSLMRSVPMALWLHNNLNSARVFNGAAKMFHHSSELIARMSAVTHAHQHSKDACWFYCIMLDSILYGKPKSALLDHTEVIDEDFLCNMFSSRIQYSIDDEDLYPVDPGAWPMRGTAEFSLYAALWCFKHSTSFTDGIEKAVRIGGDTDTYAAIAGGLLGAYYGYDAIPLEWRKTILGHDVMVDYAEKLYGMNQNT